MMRVSFTMLEKRKDIFNRCFLFFQGLTLGMEELVDTNPGKNTNSYYRYKMNLMWFGDDLRRSCEADYVRLVHGLVFKTRKLSCIEASIQVAC